jgi:hypothetical protein
MAKTPKIKKEWEADCLAYPLHTARTEQPGIEGLLDVFPVRRIQSPSDECEESQEDQNPHTNTHTAIL